MRNLLSVIAIGLLASAAPAQAEVRSVVELFTSQGCSSCPPADKILGQIARAPDVLALSFPVDYWDYIGWKDTFAKPAYTARQHAYASARGDGAVYTPQAVVDGLAPVIGSERDALKGAMQSQAGKSGAMSVAVTLSGAAVQVGSGKGSGTVWLLKIASARDVAIGRGENAGRSVTYYNVVRAMTKLGDWSGSAAQFDVPTNASDDSDGYAVVLQAGSAAKPGAILGAAKTSGL